ncbi:IS21 family transposase [Acidimicrobiaceae bacterium USS-CC1]|uniref:IS21 family transposase n=1 Tax=Acidiferrimicrobium australe TaxID=2664430 RepID=A0ABW9QR82_9ACTN|nr:IS21 family transposase [Acidiferrimicrobium australe]
MSFREVQVHEIREVLRLWVRGESERAVARLSLVDRKTAKRYMVAGAEVGVVVNGDEAQLTDEVIGRVCERVRPHRADGHGAGWETCKTHHDQLKTWLVDEGLTVVKAHQLLTRRGVEVPQRTLHRYALEELGVGRSARRRSTVPVADGEPGSELQVDFGKMGLIFDPETGRRRVVWAFIFTAVFSRHCFVWLSFNQTLETVIDGFEQAWSFFGGVFKVVIPDNMSTAVTTADNIDPRLNQAFVEYAQDRGFVIDPARVKTPTDKPRVERVVPFVRNNFFAGEQFIDLADAQRRAVIWCSTTAGMRVHGTHACRPVELFNLEEKPRLLLAPSARYDLPVYAKAKVHRDHHIECGRALYSIPGDLIGAQVDVRADSQLVRVYHRGVLIKIHPRQAPGGRVTDGEDLPSEKTAYAMRDLDHLRRLAAAEGPAIGVFADALLESPLPWTKMRQVYALLGLVKRWGAPTVDAACARALDAEAVNVPLIGRMIERATEHQATPTAPTARPTGRAPRFARDPGHFATQKPSSGKGNDALEVEGGVA